MTKGVGGGGGGGSENLQFFRKVNNDQLDQLLINSPNLFFFVGDYSFPVIESGRRLKYSTLWAGLLLD